MTEEEFVVEHVKICETKKRKNKSGYGSRGMPSGKRRCAKQTYQRLLSIGYTNFAHYNTLNREERKNIKSGIAL